MASREGEEMVESSLGLIKVGEILWLSLGILLGHCAVIVLGTSKSGTTGSEGVEFVQSRPVEGACWI